MGFLFGSKKESQTSTNTNNPLLTKTLSPVSSAGAGAGSLLGNLLGGGYGQYRKDAGLDWMQEQGSRGITGSAAARGLLNSGATGKALVNYGNNSSAQYYKDYLGQLLGLTNAGTAASGVLSDSGKTSSSSSSSKPGLSKLIGGGLGYVAGGLPGAAVGFNSN